MFGRKRLRIVRFEECELEPTDAEFYKEFRKYNELSWWIILVFFLTAFCIFSLNMDDSMVEYSSEFEVSCLYDGLKVLPWKDNETMYIFYPEVRLPCMMYDYKISDFEDMTFEEAQDRVKDIETPAVVYCSDPVGNGSFSWEPSFIGTCKGYLHLLTLTGTKYIGIAIGSIIFGIIGDLWGRKIALILSVCLHFLGTNMQSLFENYDVVRFLTAIKGIGRAGIEHMLILLLLEHAGKINRPFLIVYMTTLGPLGLLMGVHIKMSLYGYCEELRFILSIPSLMFLFYLWYVPESPRWYLSHFNKKKAWKFLNKLGTPIDNLHFLPQIKLNKYTVAKENFKYLFSSTKLIKILLLGTYLLTFLLFAEFSKNQFLALSFLMPYSHHALVCLTRMFSYMYVLLPLMMLRRRLALLWFFLLISIQIFINIFTTTNGHYTVNLLILLCIHSVANILGLYLAEVFPTCIRGTSLGLARSITFSIYTVAFIFSGTKRYITTPKESIVYFVAALIALCAVGFLPEVNLDELPDYKRYRRDFNVS